MKKKRAIVREPRRTLRDRAELAIRASRPDVARMSPEETQAMVHELQVHQVELEMQNEELRNAKADLAHSRDRFNDLFDFAPVGYMTLDDDGTILEANLTLAEMIGVKRSKFVGQKFTRFVAHAGQDAFYLHLRAMIEGQKNKTCELQLQGPDGGTFWGRMESTDIYDPATGMHRCLTAISDRTIRKRAEEEMANLNAILEQKVAERTAELKLSEQTATALVDGLMSHIAIVNHRGIILSVNQKWRQFALDNNGTLISACEGANYLKACASAARSGSPVAAAIAAGIRDVLAGKRPHYTTEYPCHSSSEQRWFNMNVTRVPGGGPARAVIAHENITARVLAERELRAGEERTLAILNTVADAIVTIDSCGKITSVNPATERIFGYTAEEMLGQNVSMLMPSPYREQHDGYLERYHRTGKPHIIGIGREVNARHKDGTVFPIDLAVSRIDHMQAYAGVIRDITQRKRLEAEVLQTTEDERLRVAADLHDGICQELVGIHLLSASLRHNLEKARHPMAAKARQVEDSISAAALHTRHVARGMNPVVEDGNGLMHALRQLTATTAARHRIRCPFECSVPVPIQNPKAATELYRIAQEAILNAVTHGRAKQITVSLAATKAELSLVVKDNGCGLPADVAGSQGMGLRVMKYRANLFGGHLSIGPRKRGGTEVICRIEKSLL
jgi:two-component system sensor kinase FixL